VLVGCENSSVNVQANKPKVVLTEYGDFQCPVCKHYAPIVDKLKKAYGDTLTVDYRYFPLDKFQYSKLAARAAQAAKDQGKFKQMHDTLFADQDEWADANNAQDMFIDYAKEIGLNVEQFKKDLNSSQTKQIVMEQKKEGEKKGVHGTPTFFVKDEEITPLPRDYDAFKARLDVFVKEAAQNQE
jgi:protein-disulfide isomerase